MLNERDRERMEALTDKINAQNKSCAIQMSLKAAKFSAIILAFFGIVFACNFLYTLLKLVHLPRIISELAVILSLMVFMHANFLTCRNVYLDNMNNIGLV